MLRRGLAWISFGMVCPQDAPRPMGSPYDFLLSSMGRLRRRSNNLLAKGPPGLANP
jgi:hypothetical protein